MRPFTLRHTWAAPGDLAALALCRDALRAHGIALEDAPDAPAHALKMHGIPLLEAHGGQLPLLDLRDAARESRWAERLPAFVRGYMTRGDAWFGIPVGVHEANCLWLNTSYARHGGAPPLNRPHDIPLWLGWARRHTPAPLAAGSEPWQLGVLFESLVLAYGGAAPYRSVLQRMQGGQWRQPALMDAVAGFLALREFVDDDALGLDWRQQLERVRSGKAAMLFMGDWVRCDMQGLQGHRVPGTHQAISIVDFFVPLAGADARTAHCVACALTEPGFQRRFAMAKGCTPAVQVAAVLPEPVPSLTFEQSCACEPRAQLLAIAAEHFLQGRTAGECVNALAAVQPVNA